MALVYKINGVTIANRIRLGDEGDGYTTAAEMGVIGSGGVLIDDPDGNLVINGYQPFTIDDTAAGSYQRVFTGFIADRQLGRTGRFRTGAARVHNCTVLDQNFLLHLHVLHSNDAKRPAETDVVRVAWLLTSEALTGLVTDEGLVSTANAGAFLEADCRERFADDVMNEMAPSAVKNFFVMRDHGSGNAALFYDRNDASVWASSERISNDRTDSDASTFYPSLDAQLTRTPEEWYGGVDYGWRGGRLYVQSATTIAAMGLLKDAVYDTDRVGRLTTATQTSKAWLNVRSGERDTVTVTIIVPSSVVTDIEAGMEIEVKFTHLPGYEDFVWRRIRRRSAIPDRAGFWRLVLELWEVPTPVDDAVPEVSCVPTIVRNGATAEVGAGNHTFPFTPTSGNLLIFRWDQRNGNTATADTGWTAFASHRNAGGGSDISMYAFWKISDGTETQFDVSNAGINQFGRLIEIAACGAAMTDDIERVDPPGSDCGSTFVYPLTPATTTGPALLLTFFDQGYDPGGTCAAPDLSEIAPWTILYKIVSTFYPEIATIARTVTGAGTYTPEISVVSDSSYQSITITIPGSSLEIPKPQVDQWVSEPLGHGNGTAVDWATTYPFMDGSLTVFVDRLDQTSAITAQDAEAGTFTLGFAPLASELVEVTYRSR